MIYDKVYPITSWRRGSVPNKRPKNGQTSLTEIGTTVGIDIRRRYDTAKPVTRATLESQSVITDQVLCSFTDSGGYTYAFGSGGNVYRRSGTTWSLVYTDTDGRITGAKQYTYNTGTVASPVYTKYIFFATKGKLRKITLADAQSVGTWVLATHVIAVGDLTYTSGGSNSAIHWMEEVNGKLLVCDEGYIAMVDYLGVYTNVALRLPQDYIAYGIYNKGNLGYIVTNKANDGAVFTWDTWQDSWIDKISTGGIARFVTEVENQLVVHSGNGFISKLNGSRMTPWYNLPRSGGGILQRGVCKHDGLTYFALYSQDAGGSLGYYIYSLGRREQEHPIALMAEYGFNGLTQNVTAMSSSGGKLTIFVYDSSGSGTYTVYTVNTDNELSEKRASSATLHYEGLDLDMPTVKKKYAGVKITLRDKLPTGASVGVIYRNLSQDIEANGGSKQWIASYPVTYAEDSQTQMVPTTNPRECLFVLDGEGQYLDMQITLTTGDTASAYAGPEIEQIDIYFTPLGSL